MSQIITPFTKATGVEVPIICGAMYPCSNPELIAAVSEAGAMGVIQPLTLVYAQGLDFRQAVKRIKSLTSRPFGFNAIVEKSSKVYEDRMRQWIDIALEEGCRFFITALGNPSWVVKRVAPYGGIVYHDIVERKWAMRALEAGVHGLICVNNRAGGHAGMHSAEELFRELSPLGVPLMSAGGIGDENAFIQAIKMGYAGVQMGTRFIATTECTSHISYKNAILQAKEEDIVLTERVTGVPLAVIKTPYVEKVGLKVGPIGRYFLRHRKTKHLARTFYNVIALWNLKRSSKKGLSSKDYWQAGKSVAGIHSIESAGTIVRRFAAALEAAK